MAGSTPVSLTADPHAGAAVVAKPAKQVRFSPAMEAWRRFRRHKLAMASAVILLALAWLATRGIEARMPLTLVPTSRLRLPSAVADGTMVT